MQICFSIASKGSTITQRMNEESYTLMPTMVNDHLNSPEIKRLASQLKIIEDLGKTCRDTPITIKDSESQSIIGNPFSRNPTQKSLGYRRPGEPIQLISYLTKQKKLQEAQNRNKSGLKSPPYNPDLETITFQEFIKKQRQQQEQESKAKNESMSQQLTYTPQPHPFNVRPPKLTSVVNGTSFDENMPFLDSQHFEGGIRYSTTLELSEDLNLPNQDTFRIPALIKDKR